jgi:hypothetical protein
VCVAFQGAALCRVYSRHCLLRDLPANVSQKFPKKLEIVGTSDNRRNTLRFRANGRANSRDYFVASNCPTRLDLLDCLHKAMVFGIVFRLLIVASIKRSLQGHPCSNASCIPITVPFSSINPDRNPLVRLLETAQSLSSFENFVPPLP